MRYTIAAKPTMYRGRQYRSRLEARWAAFFDSLGWYAEYEPLDLGGWSPDFMLGRDRPVFAEVKPIDDWDRDVAAKMSASCPPGMPILLLGLQPTFLKIFSIIGYIGLTRGGHAVWCEAFLAELGCGRITIAPFGDCFEGKSYVCAGDEIFHSSPQLLGKVRHDWVSAANDVQWHPGARR